MKLQGKVALITGAGSGIGAAAARLMAAEGASIAVTGIPAEAGAEVAAELSSRGAAAIAIPTDVSDAAQVEAAVAQTVHAFGRLDILVSNAAVQFHDRDRNLHELPEEIWDRTNDVNYRGAYLVCKYGLAQFVRQGDGGVIVIVSSTTTLGGRTATPSYVASKHGLIGLTRYIAVHYAKYGVRCNAVLPGALERVPNAELHPDPVARIERLRQTIPLGRPATPEDIAPFITFLATPDAAYATGGLFVVDGGLSIA